MLSEHELICPRCNSSVNQTDSNPTGIYDKVTRKRWGVAPYFQKKGDMGNICKACWIEIKMQTKKGRDELQKQREREESRKFIEGLHSLITSSINNGSETR